jgi:restriction endonuclease S subunit
MDILDIDDSVGAAQRNLSPKDLAALTIPLLPFSEQKRIAAIFDKADNLRSKR